MLMVPGEWTIELLDIDKRVLLVKNLIISIFMVIRSSKKKNNLKDGILKNLLSVLSVFVISAVINENNFARSMWTMEFIYENNHESLLIWTLIL